MNRMLRIFLGPVMMWLFVSSVYGQYARYQNSSTLLGQAFGVIGTGWLIAAALTFCMLLGLCFGKGSNDSFRFSQALKWGLMSYFMTHIVAKLWLYMSAQSTGSLEHFLLNGVFLILSVAALALIPTSFLFLVGALGLPKGKKVNKNAPEKPIKVSPSKKFRALSGQLYEETTSYFAKKAVTTTVPISG